MKRRFSQLSLSQLGLLASSVTLPLLIGGSLMRGISRKFPDVTSLRRENVAAILPRSGAEVRQWAEDAMGKARKQVEQVLAMDNDARTFDNTFMAVGREGNFSTVANSIGIASMVSPDPEVRKTARETVVAMSAFASRTLSRNKKLYEALKYYYENISPTENLSEKERYVLDETMRALKLAGLDLDEGTLAKVIELGDKLAEEAQRFETNIAEDDSHILVDEVELEGLPENFLASLDRVDGMVKLTCDYPVYTMVMRRCRSEGVRKKLFHKFTNRAYPQNAELLKSLTVDRQRFAELVGQPDYATLQLIENMVGSPERAAIFLEKLGARAVEKADKEFEELKGWLPDGVELTPEGQMKPWDWTYAVDKMRLNKFGIDDVLVSEFFPVEKTIEKIFEIYQNFLGIHFEKFVPPDAWAEDVIGIEVSQPRTGEILGYILLDLYPRQGKFTHFCFADVVPPIELSGGRMPAAGLVIANLPKPMGGAPALMKHSDVTTFFHEFGHAMHGMLGSTPFSGCCGTSVKLDFVEVPSQMFEEWMWDRDMLRKVSSHFQTGQSLPEELIEKIASLHYFNIGNFLARQVALSFISLWAFSAGTEDVEKLTREMSEKYMPKVQYYEHDHFWASFGHLIGYGSGYYSYMWALNIAKDFFSHIKKNGLENPVIGLSFRNKVLAHGGSKDPNDLVRDFLGRNPAPDAILNLLEAE